MSWRDDVNLEMSRAREAQRAGNEGRARTAARRAVGLAVEELQRKNPGTMFGRDFLAQLRSLAADATMPQSVRESAARLQARVAPDFRSQSTNPIEDAEVILDHIFSRLQ